MQWSSSAWCARSFWEFVCWLVYHFKIHNKIFKLKLHGHTSQARELFRHFVWINKNKRDWQNIRSNKTQIKDSYLRLTLLWCLANTKAANKERRMRERDKYMMKCVIFSLRQIQNSAGLCAKSRDSLYKKYRKANKTNLIIIKWKSVAFAPFCSLNNQILNPPLFFLAFDKLSVLDLKDAAAFFNWTSLQTERICK